MLRKINEKTVNKKDTNKLEYNVIGFNEVVQRHIFKCSSFFLVGTFVYFITILCDIIKY